MFIIFFDIMGIVHKEFVLAGQTSIPDTTVTFTRLRLEQKNWLLHHDNTPSHTYFFTRDFFYHKQHDCLPQPPYFPLFNQFKKKIKGRHFYTFEVTEA
jgi:hypothetical protein